MTLAANNIHFIGIGGTGMCGLAKVILHDGHHITGSDSNDTPVIQQLQDMGVPISLGQRGELITEETELVIYSAAIKPDNRELAKAVQLGIPTSKYAEALGAVMRDRFGIAIAGTHGKTTVSALTSWVLREGGMDPSFVIGGGVPQLGGSSHVGESDYFVVESCEFDRSFLNFVPRFAVINNIEEDHLDYFKNIDDIEIAFQEFSICIQEDGILFYNRDCPRSHRIAEACPRTTLGYGFDAASEYRGVDLEVIEGLYHFDVQVGEQRLGPFQLQIPGWYNASNALASIAIAHRLGMDAETIRKAIASFEGVERRFQLRAEIGGITILDDYAHHPTEIEAVIQTALQRFRGRRLWVVFQPHQYSRTRFLLKDFAEKLRHASYTLLPEIFFVRDSERDRQTVSASDLAREIRKRGGHGIFIPTLEAIADYLINNVDSGDVVLTMGAGDVWKITDELVRRIQAYR